MAALGHSCTTADGHFYGENAPGPPDLAIQTAGAEGLDWSKEKVWAFPTAYLAQTFLPLE